MAGQLVALRYSCVDMEPSSEWQVKGAAESFLNEWHEWEWWEDVQAIMMVRAIKARSPVSSRRGDVNAGESVHRAETAAYRSCLSTLPT